MDKIAVLIPCYNEGKTIRKVVTDFKASLPEAVIYVYDNNSTDNTKEEAEAAGAVVRDEHIQGKGNVIRRMFREIDAECYVMVDGDCTYPAESAPEMVRMVLEDGADMVIGDRLSGTYFKENKRPFHNTGNSLVRSAINSIFKSDIKDIMTGYRALGLIFVKTISILSKGFEVETEMTIHALHRGMYIKNLVIEYKDRPEGSVSKLNTYSDGIKVLATIVRLFRDYKPRRFFGMISGVLALTSIGFMVPVFIEYWQTGLVPRFPTLIACGFAMLTAIILFIAGLVLQNLLIQDKREFESKLIRTDYWKKDLLSR
jgi:glycosyltransferase involved in cell wall biosynthesis